jgi:hypothetical protein
MREKEWMGRESIGVCPLLLLFLLFWENEMDMYYPVDFDTSNPPAIMIADKSATGYERVSEGCIVVGMNSSTVSSLYLAALDVLKNKDIKLKKIIIDAINIIKPPEHGRLFLNKDNSNLLMTYIPTENYLGKDRTEIVVRVGDDQVRFVYNFVVQSREPDGLTEEEELKFCPRAWWIISEPSIDYYNDPIS